MGNNLKEMLENLETMFLEFRENANKQAEKGNAAAGKRSRKLSSAISKAMKEWRAASVDAGKGEAGE